MSPRKVRWQDEEANTNNNRREDSPPPLPDSSPPLSDEEPAVPVVDRVLELNALSRLEREMRSANLSEILERHYGRMARPIDAANDDVDLLLIELQAAVESTKLTGNTETRWSCRLEDGKLELMSQCRQFVTASKMLVSSATQCYSRVVVHITPCMHTLAKMADKFQEVMLQLVMRQAEELGARMRDVVDAFRTTLNLAIAAAGRTIDDSNMRLLMRQAAILAGNISVLMRTLKIVASQ